MAGRMNPAMLMMLRGSGDRREGEGDGHRRNAYDGQHYGGYDAPGVRGAMTPYMPPYAQPDMRRRYQTRGGYDDEEIVDRRMGFGEQPMYDREPEMRRRRRRDGTYMHYGAHEDGYGAEPIRFGGMVSMEGGRHGGHHKMTREMAEEWVENMEGGDPAKPRGGKWTPEQIKPIAQKYGVPTEGERFWEFWAVMNAMYSDYYLVAKKHNALNPDYFADMAMAFINDKDAVENKAAMYYECIVQ